jgi:hypothetical protein
MLDAFGPEGYLLHVVRTADHRGEPRCRAVPPNVTPIRTPLDRRLAA